MRRAPALVAMAMLVGCTPTLPAQGIASPSPRVSSPAPDPGRPTASVPPITVKARGASSAECLAGSHVLSNAVVVMHKAYAGKVTQGDHDAAFAGRDYASLPSDIKPYADDVKVLSAKVVGLNIAAASPYTEHLSSTVGTLSKATQQLCS